MDTAEVTRRGIFKKVGIAETLGVIVGLLYVTGYYINSIFLKNYGIPDAELLRLEYIKIGFVFWLLSSGVVFLPVGAFLLTYRVRKQSGLPHFWIGLIGNSLNTIIMLGVPLVLSFFGTRFEWYFPLTEPVLGFQNLNVAVGTALAVSAFAVIALPAIERVVNKCSNPAVIKWAFRLLVEPVRFGCLLFTTYVVVATTRQVPWLPSVFGRGLSFLAVSVVFMVGIAAAFRWIRQIERIRGSSLVYAMIMFGVSFFYYLAIATYVFGVYPSIPCNRGGRMPLTEAYFETSSHEKLFADEKQFTGYTLRGPAYIIEQSDGVVYFATFGMDKWFREFVPIHALRKEDVPYMRLERISDGFPRVERPAKGP